MLWDVRDVWNIQKQLISTSLSSDILDPRWLHNVAALWSPLTVSTRKSLTYDRAKSSALQATAACGIHKQVVVNKAKSIINNMTNLSEELPDINDTSAKMTCVIVLSINALMTCVVAGLWSMLLSFQLTFDALYGRLPMQSIYKLTISSVLISIWDRPLVKVCSCHPRLSQ